MAMAGTVLENVEKSLEGCKSTAEIVKVSNSEDYTAENGNGKVPELMYSKELLLKLKQHPASLAKPECLDPAHMVTKSGKWDPEHWMSHDSSKHPSSTTGGTNGEDKGETNKKRDKPREESDDYCFTPQRRSFVGGCQVTAARKQETDAVALPPVKEKGVQPRRPPPNQPQREQRGFPSRTQPGDKDSRRPLERTAFERDGGNRNARSNGYHDRRHADETPEWFLGGPTSQNETIELKGFDEESSRGKRKAESKKATDGPTRETVAAKTESKTEKEKEASKEEKKEPEFNFDDLLDMDTGNFNDVGLDALTGESTPLQGSKFSRWFKKAEEEKKPEEISMKDKEDAAKSLLEMLHKGSEQPVQQQQQQAKLQGVLTAEEVERMANKRNTLAALKNLLPPPKEVANQKEGGSAARPMTEQDLLASLLGDKMNVNKAPPQQNQPTEDILTKFLQTAAQQQHVPKPPEQIQQQPPVLPLPLQELQQRAALQSMLNAAAAGLNGPPTLQQLEFLAKQRQLMQVQQQLQQQQRQAPPPPIKSSSASPLAFTPTAVMRKMTADKDKEKSKGQTATDKMLEDAGVAQNQGTNTRLTGRTASQVAGPETHSSGMLPTAASVAGPPLQQLPPPPLGAFGNPMNPGNAITDMALRLLEQQQQQQLLARAVAVSATQNQLKQAIKQQQQRVSPLQQPLLPQHGPPMMPRNHFRPIHAQPAVGPAGPGFAPFLAGTLPPPGQQQPRGAAPRLREPFSNMSIQQQMAAALQAQRMNSLPNGRPLNSAQQPGPNNPLARWLAQDLPLQGPPVPNP